MTETSSIRTAILGAGFGGIATAVQLDRRGERDWRLFERAAGIGGTWWHNRYPGCACDVPSHLYSLSFFPNPDWTRRFAPAAEIQAYLERAVDQFSLRGRILLDNGIRRMQWQADTARWHLEDDAGRHWQAEFVVLATGGLSRPAVPAIDGLDTFGGAIVHTGRWPENFDLTGKRVSVIGTGASAAQLVPAIVDRVRALSVYQRTPHWILPRPDRSISTPQRRLYRRFPILQKLVRFGIWLVSEARVPGLAWDNRLALAHRALADRHRRKQVADPDLRARLRPDFDIGCKRVILSSDWYPSLAREHVELVTTPIRKITRDAVVTNDGQTRGSDVLILATGFRATDPVPRGLIIGRDGRDLGADWQDGPEAWRGVAVHGFPNLFLTLGPNTALGHNSVLLMIEAQAEFIARAIAGARGEILEIAGGEQDCYNAWLQQRLAGTVWNGGGCSSWYLHPRSGKNCTLWPGFTWQYRRMMRRADPAALHVAARGTPPST
ncbi:MAG: NAD(P)/FAD-dependent oxidoreductase [Wenzhouxiangellaceae bacterium]|nr:NAD(P)/FAD-dependent oxidoreductase [Wenzhouxiangellaceae bacterium]